MTPSPVSMRLALLVMLALSVGSLAVGAERETGPEAAAAAEAPAAMVPAPTVALEASAGRLLPADAVLLATPVPPPAPAMAAAGAVLLQGGGPPPPQLRYYALDALGSVRVTFDAAGNVIGRADYEPFGAPIAATTTGTRPRQQFTGQERDGEVGVDYFGARLYLPTHGRMPSVDPLYTGAVEDPQRWNRYAYALNSPMVLVDPDGRTVACTGTGQGQGFIGGCSQQPTHPAFVQEHSPDLFLLMQYGDYGYGTGGRGGGIDVNEWNYATQKPKPFQSTSEQTTGAATAISSSSVSQPEATLAVALPALQIVTNVIRHFPAARAAWAAATAALVARSAARLSMTPQGSRFLELAHEAALKYPGKVGRFEYHHIWPKFMGGPGNGPMVLLPAPYHQMITNEFARRAGGPLSPQAAQQIMIDVYTKYPIW